jgi:anti-sigma factor RsiW
MTRPHMFELSTLTALADGSLPAGRRRPIDERLASGPELRAELERQRRAVSALRSVEVRAPASLRSRVDFFARGPMLAPTPRAGRGSTV